MFCWRLERCRFYHTHHSLKHFMLFFQPYFTHVKFKVWKSKYNYIIFDHYWQIEKLTLIYVWRNDSQTKQRMSYTYMYFRMQLFKNFDLLNVLRPPFCTPTLGWTRSMRIIDDDEVGLNEKPEDTRYITTNTWKCDRSTESVVKLNIMESILYAIIGNCRLRNGQALGGDEIHNHGHHLPQDCWFYWDPSQGLFTPFMPGRQRIIYNGQHSKPH